MRKQLTVTIPAYNAEKYIGKCLDSLLGQGEFSGCFDRPDPRLEILVIDDGSTDETAQIAQSYASLYPEIVRVISKENGGHGSGINTGIAAASGRYFKVLDADDWIKTGHLKKILDFLETETADAVVTGYETNDERTGARRAYDTAAETDPLVESFSDFAEHFEKTPCAFQFHGLCYNTQFYKSLSLSLSEGVYYEDQEYAILPFLKAETVLVLPCSFYVYRIGRADQSVSYQKMEKSMRDMQTVLRRLVEAYEEAKTGASWTPARELFFTKRLSIAATSYYSAAFVKAEDKKQGRTAAAGFKRFLEETDPHLDACVSGKYQTLSRAGKVPGLRGLYSLLSVSPFFLRFKKLWNK